MGGERQGGGRRLGCPPRSSPAAALRAGCGWVAALLGACLSLPAAACAWVLSAAAAVLRAAGGPPRPLGRLPRHIAIILEDGNEKQADAVYRLAEWCAHTGRADYLSLYSTSLPDGSACRCVGGGRCAACLAGLAAEAARRVADRCGCRAVVRSSGEQIGQHGDPDAGRVVTVSAVRYWDGREAFAQLMSAAARGAVGGARRAEELTEKQVGPLLPTGAGGVPDPELLLVFGSCDCVYGYPPWPLAVTEILFHRSVSRYSPRDLHRDLAHYSGTKAIKGV
eukprot:TRINITY_DN56830_c0_g1_i1.p1 TRINITY_DN56830_c0_g1~~TRINITY_DN56830_c0_g1_i1.p1  ORF type:complete len:305 (+),score=68.89 TRINITY_DN56830_c0_g1_i1:78-917(+)